MMRRIAAIILALAISVLPSMSQGMRDCCGEFHHECGGAPHVPAQCPQKPAGPCTSFGSKAPVGAVSDRCLCSVVQLISSPFAFRSFATADHPEDVGVSRYLTTLDAAPTAPLGIRVRVHFPSGTSSLFIKNCSFIS